MRGFSLGKPFGQKNDDVEFWRNEIKRASSFRTSAGIDGKWAEYRDYYRHVFKEGVVNFNFMYASLASESPSILYNFPHISATALRNGYEPFAYIVETIDNRLVHQQNLVEECRDVLNDISSCGVGVVILGYDSQYGFSLGNKEARTIGETLTQWSKSFKRIEYETAIQRGMPWCLRCLPENFLVPFGTMRFSDVPWFAFRTWRPLRDVKDDSKYPASVRSKIQSSIPGTDFHPVTDEKFEGGQFPSKLAPVYMWQIHDRRSGKVYVLADGLDDGFLREGDDPLQTDLGLPAETVQFIKDPIWFWGIPEVRYYEGHQLEYNEINAQERAFRQNALVRFLYDTNAIDEPEMAKMLGGEPMIGIRVNSQGMKIGDKVMELKLSSPPDLSKNKSDIREQVRELSGKGANYMGKQLGKTHITAEETSTASQQAGGRDGEKRQKLGRFIERIMSKQNEFIFKFWNTERIEQVVGPDMVSYWVKFKGSDIKSNYLLQVSVDDMAPLTREVKIKEAQELLAVMSKDQVFQQMYPEAALQVRKMILTQYSWLNFRKFEPREGVGGNPQQPFSAREFASEFPGMQKRGANKLSLVGGGLGQ